jgi:hypothetical protein
MIQELCPLYNTMFSDAYPRYMVVLKRLDRLPPWIKRSWDYHQRLVFHSPLWEAKSSAEKQSVSSNIAVRRRANGSRIMGVMM